jgi:hypothetical protein
MPYACARCTVRDADGAPYLRYFNRKMKREALVPIGVELEQHIVEHRVELEARLPWRRAVPPGLQSSR